MLEQLHDKYKNIPPVNVSPISMENPNDAIKIYSGEFLLKGDKSEFRVNGSMIFSWYPTSEVRIEGDFLDDLPPFLNTISESEIYIDGRSLGKIFVTNLQWGESVSFRAKSNVFIWGDKEISVSEISFAIPNMSEFFGTSVKDIILDTIKIHNSRLTFEDSLFIITLDKLIDFKVRKEKLDDKGGYLILYAGNIKKRRGSISLSEVQKWHNRFHHFLYFLNGKRVCPMFYSGIHDDEKIWTDYSNYNIDQFKYVQCWSNILRLDDLSQLWKSYNKLWGKELDQDFLVTLIHWYVEANLNAGMVEGSIILIQTALELVYNWLIVEQQKVIIGNEAEGLSAANKIRILIFQFKISSAIPPSFKDLAAIPNIQDGPEAFTKIRNALVHGQETKRAELEKITFKAKYEALQLGIWYVELALLYIMDYKGKYRNRTSENNWLDMGEYVPWANDKSFKVGKPSDFSDDELRDFVDLLEKQGKVNDPSMFKVKRCKLIGMGYSWGKTVAIGAIKPKTISDFESHKANLPEKSEDYDWEIGYFFTEPFFESKGFSSTILNKLLECFGNGKLLATTEIRDNNRMVNSLERRGFKQFGSAWKSTMSENSLRLFLRE